MGSGKIASLLPTSDDDCTMPSNQDTLFRHWHMLRLIPRYPSKITVRALSQRLGQEGFNITVRTLQRDLQDLCTIFPLVVDDQDKPFGWSWQKDAASFDLPGLTVPEALTLAMVEQYLAQMLPVSVTEQLKPHFKAAHQRLDHDENLPKQGRSWLDKVRTVPPNQPLIPPQINHTIQQEVSYALLHEKQLKILYRKKGEQSTNEYRIHPLGMVQRGPVLYLHCRMFDYEDTRILAIHRIEEATALADNAIYPPDFDMDNEIQQGVWGFGSGDLIELVLRFTAIAGEHLSETPLSDNQTLETLADGYLLVRATVPDTQQLFWWLLGFGHQVEVVAPLELRGQLQESLLKTLSLYS